MPSDPFIDNVPQTTQQITFYRYTRALSQPDTNAVLLQAANPVIAQLSTTGNEHIMAQQLNAESMHVLLTLRPGAEMTRTMWGATLKGITNFMHFFECVGFQFMVHEFGFWGPVGGGSLIFVPV